MNDDLLSVLLISLTYLLIFTNCRSDRVNYDVTIAGIAAQYASCSVTTDYLPEISNWTYVYCTNAQSIKSYIHDLKFIERRDKNLFALVLYDQQKDMIVVSFRGTVCGAGNANGKTDLNLEYKLYQEWGCTHGLCHAHTGFLNAYNLMKDQFRESIKLLAKKYPTASIMVTGVSLGAALATFASYDLKMYFQSQRLFPKFHFYTFGQPRVGNYYFVQEINKRITIYRVVDSADPVPHLPTRKIPGTGFIYYHPGVQVYYQNPNSSDYSICAGDNNKCSLKRKGLYYACNHLYYPLMNFEGKGEIRNERFNFGITEVQQLKENEDVLAFFLHQCKVTCMHMDSMFCPYYRIPQLHCQPLEMRRSLLLDWIQLYLPSNEYLGYEDEGENKKSIEVRVCNICEKLARRSFKLN